jgi:cytochrome c-type biogenesis protein CcmH/NrfF
MTSDRRIVGLSDCNRRQFLELFASGLLLSVHPTIQQSVDSLPSGRLFQPDWAGRPADPVTAKDNLVAIQAIEKRLRCTCGCGLDIYTCRTTDFSCSYSPALHRQVLRQYEAGRTAQQIIDGFVREHGQASLMAPPKRGFNLLGYFLPGTAVLGAAVILTLVLRRWVRVADPVQPPSPLAEPDATPAELDRLRHELEELNT